MRISALRALGIGASMLFFVPFVASAQANVTHSPVSPAPGFTTYQEYGGFGSGGLTNYNATYGANLKADAQANGSQYAGGGGTAPNIENGVNSYVAHYFNNGYPDNTWARGSGAGASYTQPTLNRLCYLLDPAHPDTTATGSGNYYEYVSGSADDNTLLYSGTQWYLLENDKHYSILGLAGSNAGSVLQSILCKSYALPSQTLTASTYTPAAAGDPVTLTWQDLPSRDLLWPLDTSNPTSSTYYDYHGPTTTCTSSGFDLAPPVTQHACMDWESCSDTGHSCSGYYCAFPKDVTATMPSSGSVVVNPTTTTTYTYTCTNANGTTVASATITAGAATKSDLTAGAVTPTSATAGTAATFSATVSNLTSIATGAGFTDLFQKASDASGTGASDIGTYASAAIAGSGSNTASLSYTFPANGTWYVRVCADKSSSGSTGVIAEANETNNCGAWTAVTVAPGPGPDLTASDVSPISGLVGPLSLSAGVSNLASAPTSGGFTDLFEVNADTIPADFASIQSLRTYSSTALAGGASNTATASYNFASAGTWYVRVCANTDTSNNPVVSESDVTNNCGAWTAITITNPPISPCYGQGCTTCTGDSCTPPPNGCQGSGCGCAYSGIAQPSGNAAQCCSPTPGVCTVPPPVPTATLNATPSDIVVGQTSTLTWNSSNATSCTGTAPITTAFHGTVSTGQLNTVGVQNYQVRCSGAGGTSNIQTASVTVEAPGVSITANPPRVPSGSSSTITWSATSVNACTVTGPSGVLASGNGTGPSKIYADHASPKITAQSLFTITCTTAGTNVGKSVVVNVPSAFQEF